MGNKGSCRMCRDTMYRDSRKFFNEKLCYQCAVLCGFNVQFLVPEDERKSPIMWPRTSYNVDKFKINSIPLEMRL